MASYLERVAAAGAQHWRQPAGLRRVFRPGIYPATLAHLPGELPDQTGGAEAAAEPLPAELNAPAESGAAPAAAGPDDYVGIAPKRDRPPTDAPRRAGGRAGRTPALSTPGRPLFETRRQRHMEVPGDAEPASEGAPTIVRRPRSGAVSSRSLRRPGSTAPTGPPMEADPPSPAHAAEEPTPRTTKARGRTASRPAQELTTRGRPGADPAPKTPVTREPAMSLEPHDASNRGESPGLAGVPAELAHHRPAGQFPVSTGSTPAVADQLARAIPAGSLTAGSVATAALAIESHARAAGVLPASPGPPGRVPASAAAVPITPMPKGAGSHSVSPSSTSGLDRGAGQRESKPAERATIVIGRMQVEVVHRPAVVRRQRPSAAPTASGSLDRGHLGRVKLTP